MQVFEKKEYWGRGEVQWFRILVALPEELGSILTVRLIAHNHLNSNSKRSMPSSNSMATRYAHEAYANCRQNTHAHKLK